MEFFRTEIRGLIYGYVICVWLIAWIEKWGHRIGSMPCFYEKGIYTDNTDTGQECLQYRGKEW